MTYDGSTADPSRPPLCQGGPGVCSSPALPTFWSETTETWRSTASAVFKNADVEIVLGLIECASAGDPDYHSDNSDAVGPLWGLFGFAEAFWPIHAHHALVAGYTNGLDVTSPADQFTVAAYLIYATPQGFAWFTKEVS
jgi:hypothetical protein